MAKKSSIICLVLLILLAMNSCSKNNSTTIISHSKVAKTGQTSCYDAAGTVISCSTSTAKGQDGALQVGVTWPNPRFTDNGDQTINDNLTNLIWSQDGNAPGPAACGPGVNKTWQEALVYVTCLNANSYLGYNDWRLPNINELYSLVNFGQPSSSNWLASQGFINVQFGYWSSTSTSFPPEPDIPTFAKVVDLNDDWLASSSKTNTIPAWPVRGGQPAVLPKTGQTGCYDTAGSVISCATTTAQGQDGALQMGVAWPSPRFTDNGDQTLTDNLTNLVWVQDVFVYSPACPAYTDWPGALDYVSCLNTNNYLGYNHWRIPNVNEMFSLINYGEYNNSTWLTSQGFVNVLFLNDYMTSTSVISYPYYKRVQIDHAYLLVNPKTEITTMWLVRGGR
jgi:hypothetical protein